MKITALHLTFWQQKKAPPPRWSRSIPNSLRINHVGIHGLINSQVLKQKHSVEPNNTLAILKGARRSGTLRITLLRLASISEPTYFDNAKRMAYCRRWVRRMAKEATP